LDVQYRWLLLVCPIRTDIIYPVTDIGKVSHILLDVPGLNEGSGYRTISGRAVHRYRVYSYIENYVRLPFLFDFLPEGDMFQIPSIYRRYPVDMVDHLYPRSRITGGITLECCIYPGQRDVIYGEYIVGSIVLPVLGKRHYPTQRYVDAIILLELGDNAVPFIRLDYRINLVTSSGKQPVKQEEGSRSNLQNNFTYFTDEKEHHAHSQPATTQIIRIPNILSCGPCGLQIKQFVYIISFRG
jgi:hypothetical protein